MDIYFHKLRNSPALFEQLSGMDVDAFDALYRRLSASLPEIDDITISKRKLKRKQHSTDARYRLVSRQERLLLALIWLEWSPTYAALGALFKLDSKLVKKNVRSQIDLLMDSGEEALFRQRIRREPSDIHDIVTSIPRLISVFDVRGENGSAASDPASAQENPSVERSKQHIDTRIAGDDRPPSRPVLLAQAVGADTMLRIRGMLQSAEDYVRQDVAYSTTLAIAVMYLAVIALIEYVLGFVDLQIGFVAGLGLLIALLVHAAAMWHHPIQPLLRSLILVPLLRLISLSLPLQNIPVLFWYVLTAFPVLVGARTLWIGMRFDRRDLGLTLRALPLQVLIAPLIGLPLGYFQYSVLTQEPLSIHSTFDLFAAAALVMLSVGFTQEIIFRGLLQRASVNVLGRDAGIVYVAVLYSILHMGTLSTQIMLMALVTGLLYGAIVERTGSILGVSAAQGIASIIALVYLPLESISAIPG